jgi:type I restriction enzyme S subunit
VTNQLVYLEEVAEFINGRAFKPSEWSGSGLPIIRIQNLTGTSDAFNYFNGVIDEPVRVRRGDILISWSASLGVYRWQGKDALLNQHIFKVRLSEGVEPDYFFYAATHAVQEMKLRVHGSTMQHITKDRFDSIQIRLPDLSEQRQIAGQVEQADRLRRTRHYALELTDTFLPSAFIKLFGDPEKNPLGLVGIRTWRTVPGNP